MDAWDTQIGDLLLLVFLVIANLTLRHYEKEANTRTLQKYGQPVREIYDSIVPTDI